MGVLFSSQKKHASRLRKTPWLPRLGIYIDIAGYELTLKQVPLLETAINLVERGLNLAQLRKIRREQFSEIKFPNKPKKEVIQTTARTISVVDLVSKIKPR